MLSETVIAGVFNVISDLGCGCLLVKLKEDEELSW
jgi:hypothetical protein